MKATPTANTAWAGCMRWDAASRATTPSRRRCSQWRPTPGTRARSRLCTSSITAAALCPIAWASPEPAWIDDSPEIVDLPDPFADLPPWKQQIADLVAKLAPRYDVDPRLALALIQVESNFEVRAVSIKNARGLMQLVPKTAARFKVANPFDARDNVRGGLAYLRWLLAYYRGRVPLVVAAYNAGEAAVDRYQGIPPYAETRDYVQRVLRLYRREQHPYNPGVTAPSPIVAPR